MTDEAPKLNTWLTALGIVVVVTGFVPLALGSPDPDSWQSAVLRFFQLPGILLWILLGCSPHTDRCSMDASLVLWYIGSPLLWGLVLVGIPWLIAEWRRARAGARAA